MIYDLKAAMMDTQFLCRKAEDREKDDGSQGIRKLFSSCPLVSMFMFPTPQAPDKTKN